MKKVTFNSLFKLRFFLISFSVFSSFNLLCAENKDTGLIANTGIDMTPISNKLTVLKLHTTRYATTPTFSNFKYSFKILTETEYQTQKPSGSFPFDVGFIATDGIISVSEPVTSAQKAVFADINKAALYYLCQSYIQFYYNTTAMPVWLKVGFAAFEAHLDPPDASIKTALNAYGGSISSFTALNDLTTFNTNNGFAIAYAFGEYMNIYKNWGYPNMYVVDANNINVDSWWLNVYTLDQLLKLWNNYLKARFLEPTESLRIKMYLETDHFKFYTREADSKNFPAFNTVLESAYTEYVTNFGVSASEKLTFFTLPECIDAVIDEATCGNRVTGGTAWSSGLHSTCAATVDQIPLFEHQNRHELGHVFQGLFPQGTVTAWLNEGFPSFVDRSPVTDQYLIEWRQQAIDGLNTATQYFGHRPTYEDTKVYPSTPYWDYYTLGLILNYYIYQRGNGFTAVKEVQMNDLAAYNKMGYATRQAFLDDFYFYFDVKVQGLPVVTLINPKTDITLTSSTVNLNWTALKADTKLNVYVSTDNKNQWNAVATGTTQSSCSWNAGTFIGGFYLKFVTPDNLNLESVFGPFNLTDPTKVTVINPKGGDYFIAGDTIQINWSTAVPNIKIEFSGDNGSSWSTVNSSVASSLMTYKWIVPWTLSNQCKIRISDATNSTNYDLSDNNFTILRPNLIGGPYLFDKNTVALLHFDNDLKNRSNLSGNGVGSIQNIVSDATLSPILGNCVKTTSTTSVPHNSNLSLSGDWTIEAWVKVNSLSTNSDMFIITKPGDTNAYESNYSLDINPWWGNVFFAFFFSATNSRIGLTSNTVKLNEWYHIAMTRDTKSKVIMVYIHDKNRNTLSVSDYPYTPTTTYLNSKDLLIGSGIDGFVDEVRISNVVRSFATTDTEQIKCSDLFSVYPNPSSGMIQLKLNNNQNSTVDIEITNLNGQLVFSEKKNSFGNCLLNLNHLPKGLYLLKVKDDIYCQTDKIMLK